MSHAPFPPAGFNAGATLAEGAAGATFVVEHDDRCFLCKRLSARARDDEGARRRLADEGRILDALAGRGAPRLVARGEDGHGPFVVMEQIAMTTLEAHARAAPGAAWVNRAACSALEALAMVHEATDGRGPLAIVHADISPANLLVADDGGAAVLVDFGLARWRDGSDSASSTFRGTVAYAAPEVARGEAFDTRADLFALAASLLHAASGTAPRPALPDAALLAMAGDQPVAAWSATASAALPSALARVLVACVAHSADERPPSAREALARAMCAE